MIDLTFSLMFSSKDLPMRHSIFIFLILNSLPLIGAQALPSNRENSSTYIPRLKPVALDKDFVDDLLGKAPRKIREFNTMLTAPEFEGDRPHNLLLIGRPGTGKSTLAQALAQSSKRLYSIIYAPTLGNEYQNSTAQNIEKIFYPLIEQKEPCVVVIDEFMSILKKHNEKNDTDNKAGETLQIVMDLCAKYQHITLIATANSIRNIPAPLKSRFKDSIFEMKLPTWKRRTALIEKTIGQKLELSAWTVWNLHRWNRIRYNSWGWSHRETVLFAKKALRYAKLRSIETKEPIKVTWEDCSRALEDINGECRWYHLYYNHEAQITAKWLTDLWRTDVVQKLAEYGDVGIKGYIGGVTGAMGQNHVNREQIATNIAHMKKMEAHADENSKMQKESLDNQKKSFDIQQQIHEAQQQALKEQFEMQQKALAAQQQAYEEQQKFNKEQKEKLEETQSAKNIALNAAITAAAAGATQEGLGFILWLGKTLFWR